MFTNQLIELSKGLHLAHTGNGAAPEPGERLVIALDFGTTFSGIAYCFPMQKNPSPVAIMNWPGAEGISAPKIPTLIRYDKTDLTKFQWGASVGSHSDNIVGVKLLLDPSQRRPYYLPANNILKDIKALPKPPVEVAADYIGAIFRHALSEISIKVPKSYLDICQKDYVLSVPAVWSDAAKHATLQAAKLAGIYPVKLIKEPEAAGLYTAKSMDLMLQRGNTFVICDAGGGTVDLVSYEIEAVLPGLQAMELVPGTGGMAGSLGLNQLFASAVEKLVGDDQWYILKKSKAFLHAEKEFDRDIKTRYRGKQDEEYFVNFPMADLEDDPDNNLNSNCWTMTGNDLEDIFDPLITNILELIDRQVEAVKHKRPEKGVTGIFLVGGFGSSQYLRGRVEKRFPDIQVLQPNDAWAAIAKGAALSMMPRQAIVTSTSATRHYGVEAGYSHDAFVDKGQPTYVDRDGATLTGRMKWYIKIGDDLLRDQKIKFSFRRNIDDIDKPGSLIFINRLIQCEDKSAPLHRSKGERIGTNCTVVSDLSEVPRYNFALKADKDGNTYWKVIYDLVITLQTAVMKFSLEVNGKELGSVEAKFD